MNIIARHWMRAALFALLLACAQAAFAQSASKQIAQGTQLWAGEEIYSNNGQYKLSMQHDGNLVFYRVADLRPLWNSGTQAAGGHRASFEAYGILTVRDFNDAILWSNANGWPGYFHPGIYWYLTDTGYFVALYQGSTVVRVLGRDPDRS
ncbi:hypothetical protein K4L06_21355 [Lysobacter sp. BMK333-48F3]|uniref:hypothetical protein n=1 Tax=Lysobacter sp. BMK333-48F3 TaxID=2867962 RepID=UPI001C8BE3B7|nr:hypothetical protein [Lysobacter sp. BMK333-48F3]MBX9403859.1 hypothetical protein [Lysobacter sp. BMK333-48F3]